MNTPPPLTYKSKSIFESNVVIVKGHKMRNVRIEFHDEAMIRLNSADTSLEDIKSFMLPAFVRNRLFPCFEPKGMDEIYLVRRNKQLIKLMESMTSIPDISKPGWPVEESLKTDPRNLKYMDELKKLEAELHVVN